MATNDDGKARVGLVSAGEALGAQIAETMALKVLEVIRVGGYRPTPEQFAAMARGTTQLSLALGRLIADGVDGGAPAPSDEEIDALVERAALGGVLELLGPPAAQALN